MQCDGTLTHFLYTIGVKTVSRIVGLFCDFSWVYNREGNFGQKNQTALLQYTMYGSIQHPG